MMKSLRFYCTSTGSEGDIRQIIALGIGLKGRGHQVVVCASPDLEPLVAPYGLNFKPIGEPIMPVMRRLSSVIGRPLRGSLQLVKTLRGEIEKNFIAFHDAAADADVIVGCGVQFVAPSIAEKLNVPYWYATVTPQLFKSAHYPPLGTASYTRSKLLNRVLWFLSLGGFNLYFMPLLNRYRRQIGLRPAPDEQRYAFSANILDMDETLVVKPSDLRVLCHQTGYWYLKDDRELPAHLRRFIDAGDPPVYIGFGSIPETEDNAIQRMLDELAHRLGRRLIISQGWAGLSVSGTFGNVMRIGHVSHDRLFPRVACVVHHGGGGTMYTAARAGIPQVLVPHMMDQFFWGDRLFRLGLTPKAINRHSLTAPSLIDAIQNALFDDSRRERITDVAARLRGREGVAEAIDLLGW